MSDRGGAGGILALGEAGKVGDGRRQVWTVAGDGLYLRQMLVAGTPNGVDEEGRSTIDWIAPNTASRIVSSRRRVPPLPFSANWESMPNWW